MWDLFHHPLQDEEWFAVCVLLIVASIFGLQVLKAVLAHLRDGRDADHATALKMEMIQRGMAASEIERVLAARIPAPAPEKTLAGQVGRAAGELVRKAAN